MGGKEKDEGGGKGRREGRKRGRRGGGRGRMVVQMGGDFFGVFFIGGQNVNKGGYGDLGGGKRERV